jgi:phage gp45-like
MTSIYLESNEFVTTDGVSKTNLTKTNGTCSSNAVTVNGSRGIITCESLTTAADAEQDITVTNSVVATTSLILLTAQYSGGGNVSVVIKSISSGSFVATLQNTGTAALDAAPKIHYQIIN